jgi:hypothetical protein
MQYGAEKIIKSWAKDFCDMTEIVLDIYVSRIKQHQDRRIVGFGGKP